jgi:Short C-terminal domain
MDPNEEKTYRKYLEEVEKQLLPSETILAPLFVSFGLKPGVLALTEARIIVCHARTGTSGFGVRRAEVRLADVKSVDFSKGSIRDGTRNQVTIASASGRLGPLAIDEAEGRRWAELAESQLRKINQDQVPQPSGDLAQQLTQLAELHGQGALSDREFEAAKARLLGVN